MRTELAIVVLCACGRIGFDPSNPHGDGGGLGASPDDGNASIGDASGIADNCAQARVLTLGVTLQSESIAGAKNDYPSTDPSTCVDGPEVVYAYQQTTQQNRKITITTTFNGSYTFGWNCPPTIGGGCGDISAYIFGTATDQPPPGTAYIVIDKTSGAGSTFSIKVE
jgi:hypothetical protein